ARVRAAVGEPGLAVEVLSDGEWTAAALSAARYRQGPVFLAGDAAHRVPPAGATGVSAAIADVHNLAWQLAAVWRGEAGEALLDPYAAGRGPVGRRNAEAMGAVWLAMTGGRPPAVDLRAIDLGYRYASAAVVDDGTPSAPPGAGYAPSAAPG